MSDQLFGNKEVWYSDKFVSNKGGWNSNTKNPRYVVDVDADGKADVVGLDTYKVHVSLSSGQVFEKSEGWSTSSWNDWRDQNQWPMYFADINGDGGADLVAFESDVFYTDLAVNKFQQYQTHRKEYNEKTDQNAYPIYLADVNGDRRADIVLFNDKGITVALSSGASGFQAAESWSGDLKDWNDQSKWPIRVADVNGDGKADILGFGTTQSWVLLSDGNKFGARSSWGKYFSKKDYADKQIPLYLVDMNNDDKADIVAFSENGVQISFSTGKKFLSPRVYSKEFPLELWKNQDLTPIRIADVNGDGYSDLIGFGKDYIEVAINKATQYIITEEGPIIPEGYKVSNIVGKIVCMDAKLEESHALHSKYGPIINKSFAKYTQSIGSSIEVSQTNEMSLETTLATTTMSEFSNAISWGVSETAGVEVGVEVGVASTSASSEITASFGGEYTWTSSESEEFSETEGKTFSKQITLTDSNEAQVELEGVKGSQLGQCVMVAMSMEVSQFSLECINTVHFSAKKDGKIISGDELKSLFVISYSKTPAYELEEKGEVISYDVDSKVKLSQKSTGKAVVENCPRSDGMNVYAQPKSSPDENEEESFFDNVVDFVGDTVSDIGGVFDNIISEDL